jgi:hypothetical protein
MWNLSVPLSQIADDARLWLSQVQLESRALMTNYLKCIGDTGGRGVETAAAVEHLAAHLDAELTSDLFDHATIYVPTTARSDR